MRRIADYPFSRRITQFLCPKLSETTQTQFAAKADRKPAMKKAAAPAANAFQRTTRSSRAMIANSWVLPSERKSFANKLMPLLWQKNGTKTQPRKIRSNYRLDNSSRARLFVCACRHGLIREEPRRGS